LDVRHVRSVLEAREVVVVVVVVIVVVMVPTDHT
jgi:hypothetical protein